MRKPEVYLGNPIRSLQTMLRHLSDDDPRILPLIPDGFYGPNTHSSVRSFQEVYGLPVTGRTDHDTWPAIANAYGLLPAREPLHVSLAQAQLAALARHYPAVTAPQTHGVLDTHTKNGLRWVQKAAGLPETGGWDHRTRYALEGLFRTMPW